MYVHMYISTFYTRHLVVDSFQFVYMYIYIYIYVCIYIPTFYTPGLGVDSLQFVGLTQNPSRHATLYAKASRWHQRQTCRTDPACPHPKCPVPARDL